MSVLCKDWTVAPNGLSLPAEFTVERYRPKRRPLAIDLFAGCGGFSLGFMQAGFEVVAAVEQDIDSVLTYAANLCRYGSMKFHFIEPADTDRMERRLSHNLRANARAQRKNPGQIEIFHTAGSGWISHQPATTPGVSHIFVGDVRKISGAQILEAIGVAAGEIACVMGGPPCQGFSLAGRRDVMDDRNSLVFEFVRLVLEIKPHTLVMESVPGISTMQTPEGLSVMDAIMRALADGDFATLDALKAAMTATNLGVFRKTGGAPVAKKRSRSRKLLKQEEVA